MGLYKNDSLKGKEWEYIKSGDDIADEIAGFALAHLAPLIRIIIYSGTAHNKSLTAQICGCGRKEIQRLIASLTEKSAKDSASILKLNNPLGNTAPIQLPPNLDNIKAVVDLLKPFLPRYGGNPKQLNVSPDELDNTMEVLKNLAVLYRSKPGSAHN